VIDVVCFAQIHIGARNFKVESKAATAAL
jgi:hypothetical protein